MRAPDVNSESVTILTADGFALEAERAHPTTGNPDTANPDTGHPDTGHPGTANPGTGKPPRAAVVLCHPHPQHGGTMRAVVISPLFTALPKLGCDTLRFNFRGVERSLGTYDEGRGEQLDVEAAVLAHAESVGSHVPLILIGFSFGADLALSCTASAITAHCVLAPPLRFGEPEVLATDPRRKHLILAAHDEYREPSWAMERAEHWSNTTIETIAGANHFFVARTDQLIAAVSTFIEEVVAPTH